MMRMYRLLMAFAAATVLLSNDVFAHDMDLNVQIISPSVMQGTLKFSDESSAESQYIGIENLSEPTFSTLGLQTNSEGRFTVAGIPGHSYRITAEGDEGHTISVDIVMQVAAPVESTTNWPPLYVIIGTILLLSLIPAHRLRKR